MNGAQADRRGLLIILSSPSGAGKSTLARKLRDWDTSLQFSVSSTTRPPREGEVEGLDYYFTTQEDFRNSVNQGDMLEHARVFGNYYGSPRAPVQEAIEAGRDVLFDVDWQGAQQISNSALKDYVLSIFILPPSIAELKRRLVSRGQDSPDTIALRMAASWDEISHWDGYDYVLVNDDLAETEARLKAIITAERFRRSQQPRLVDHVRKLQTEFEDDT
ncbi:Guanylate kinase [Sulfitobacter noctilucicola]|uniref:Guanylate kinase n=1 Tax=Sulfitobacter noctilucicola TaxID=1342301 RepID=A0A7W6M7G7_9RHOB|nr:guanylate kinase [Sulfitobacter noctilucicola]KIN65010.1 Guanylate kinase [Sulfitobacter noctilucicola]MBB4173850.1 guanylate kinase [Sulfitobacter noctilucicola]